MEAPRIGELAASASIVLHELTPLASLEDAFMELTSGSLEFGRHGPDPVAASGRECPMTSASPVTPARVPAVPSAGRAGFGGLLRAEWTKIRSVRSTVWTLIVFVVITVGFTTLFTWLTVANWNGPRAAPRDATVVVRSDRLHPGRWDRARPAHDLRAGRACDHDRVLDGGYPRFAACRAAADPDAGRQGCGVRGAADRGSGDRLLRLVLRRLGHPAQPGWPCR